MLEEHMLIVIAGVICFVGSGVGVFIVYSALRNTTLVNPGPGDWSPDLLGKGETRKIYLLILGITMSIGCIVIFFIVLLNI